MARYSFFVTLLSFVLTICINDTRSKSVRRIFSFTRDRTCLPINKVSSKPRPSYRNFHQKSAHIPSGRSFPVLQLLPYNRKEKGGGKTNLFLLHFHFLPIWNCESRAQRHCVSPLSLSLSLKWHSVSTRGEGKRNRRIKHFPPPPIYQRSWDSFRVRPSRPYASPDICLNPLWILSKLEFKLSFWRLLRKFWYIYTDER